MRKVHLVSRGIVIVDTVGPSVDLKPVPGC